MPGPEPFASIVVPTHDRAATLADCVESLLAQSYPADRYEVIVVENGSTEGGARLRTRFGDADARLHIVTLPGADANTARNAGVQAARGEAICLVDDDVVAPPGWLAALVGGLVRHGADCGGGPVSPRYDARPMRTCERHELSGTTLDEGPVDKEFPDVWGCNMAITRRALDRVGPFKEGLRVQQEWEWLQRLHAAGGSTFYVADAGLEHRRLAEDMRPVTILKDCFARGWILGRHRAAVQPRDVTLAQARAQTARAGRSLLHWPRARCTRGLLDFARASSQVAGSLEGLLRRRLRRPGAPG